MPWVFLLLVLIIVVGLGLRLHGINWDSGYGFHPDERDIYMRSGCMFDLLTEAPGHSQCGYLNDEPEAEPGLPGLSTLLDPDRSPLNPHWFPLGSILIYTLLFFRSVVELFTDLDALDLRYIGRALSALADTGSILLVYLLGRRMYGSEVGVLAAAFTALAVIHIQNSHFYRPETFSVLFTLASFWAMLRMVERRRLRDSALLGLMVGLALAPKVNVLPLVLPLALAYGYWILDGAGNRWTGITSGLVLRMLLHAMAAMAVATAVFFVASPYALIDFRHFVGDLLAQANMARNAGLWPFTVQYIDTSPFIYQVRQSALWGLGLPLGIVAWAAVPFTLAMAFIYQVRRRSTLRSDLLVLAWVVPSFLLLESFEVRFLRYVFPLMPFLVLMGSRMLVWLVEWSRRQTSRTHPVSSWGLKWLPVGLVAIVLAATAFHALAFQRVYANDHPAVEASQWIRENVPDGSGIVSDNHWDEFVPELHRYSVWQYPLYEPDTPAKMQDLASHLAGSDFLVFYSNRPFSSAARDPERFPLSLAYYRRLFGGELGYRLERAFTSYPSLAGVEFRDEPLRSAGLPVPGALSAARASPASFNLGYADDNVTGYDHPRVLVFRNADRLSVPDLRLLLTTPLRGAPERPVAGLMLSDDEKAVQQAGGTWSKLFDRSSWTNRAPVIAWLLVVELAYLAALPLCMFIFRPLPDRGIILARIVGLLGVSYVAWLTVSLGWLDFSRGPVGLGFLVVAVLSGLVLMAQWREILGFLRRHWRLLAGGEALFLAAFLAFVGVRAANPDLWHPWLGGEKPMELAYLNAVVRSTSLPPFDPWFSGGYLNYYYFGYFVLGGLIQVTGILPTIAFNLAVPLFFALTVTGAYTLVYNLTEGVRWSRNMARNMVNERDAGVETSSEEAATPGRLPPEEAPNAGSGRDGPASSLAAEATSWRLTGWSPMAGGLLAAMFVAVIGNLDGIVQLVQGAWHKMVHGGALPSFDFWRSSRMLDVQENFDPSPLLFWVPDKAPGAPDLSPHITEFPFFTFLFADLHPHMMVVPFTLLVIGLGMTLAVGLGRYRNWWAAAVAVVLALALGSLWVINSWDYPTYLLLTLGFLAVAVYFKPAAKASKPLLLGVLAAGVIVLSLLLFLPFHQSYEAFNAGLEASRWRTPIDRFLGMHGLFLVIIASFLVYSSRRTLASLVAKGAIGRLVSARGLRKMSPPEDHPAWLGWTWVLGLGLGVLLGVTGYWTAVVLLGLLLLTATSAWTLLESGREDRPYTSVVLLLLGMALALAIGLDFLRIEGDIGRMNTFFKYSLEVWVLLSLVSAYMLVTMGLRLAPRGRWAWAKGAWICLVVLLVGCSLVYTALGTKARTGHRFNSLPATLDGSAYMGRAVHFEREQAIDLKWDLEAIRWLQDHVSGSPVVLEAHTEQYHWGSRIAAYTGLPTVLGWPWHQTQQRSDYYPAIVDRAARIAETYNTTDLAKAQDLLRRFDVKYVVVGGLERTYYRPDGLRKFVELKELGLIQEVFRNSGVSIYQVN